MVYGKMEKAIMVVKANVEKIKISNLQYYPFESINIDIYHNIGTSYFF